LKTGKKAKLIHEPSHPADMQATWANITKAKELLDWQPLIKIEQDIDLSVDCFKENHSWATKIKL